MNFQIFEDYYQEHSPEKLWENLLINRSIIYNSAEIAKQLLKYKKEYNFKQKLTTNSRQSYFFAPHFNFWHRTLENFLRKQVEGTIISINLSSQWKNDYFKIDKTHMTFNSLEKYTKEISKALNKFSKIILMARSNVINKFLHEKELLDFIPKLSGIITLDEPAFFNKNIPVHINDQMINWKTCLNFYTCPHNKKHFLPIFAKDDEHYYNLLNLHDPIVPIDDYFEITSEFKMCDCGRYYADFEFIPHIENAIQAPSGKIMYDLSLANELNDSRIQFLQRKIDEVTILFKHEVNEHDRTIIEDYFEEFNVFYKEGEFIIGRKCPAFWKDLRPSIL